MPLQPGGHPFAANHESRSIRKPRWTLTPRSLDNVENGPQSVPRNGTWMETLLHEKEHTGNPGCCRQHAPSGTAYGVFALLHATHLMKEFARFTRKAQTDCKRRRWKPCVRYRDWQLSRRLARRRIPAGASQSVVTFATIMFRSRGDSDLFLFMNSWPH